MTIQQDAPATDVDEEPEPRRSGSHTIVYVLAAVALLLFGAAAGMMLTRAAGDETAVPGMDSVDVGFCQDMGVHHLQAVTMAAIARERSTDRDVRALAFDIEGGQTAQFGMMSGWLNLWARPAHPDGPRMAWLPDGASGHNTHTSTAGSGTTALMPGMATTDEITRLRSLSGAEFDVYFLQLMVRHHQGGLPMARYTADHAGVAVVRNLAAKIVRAQTHDNNVMTKMLTDRGAQPLPAPN